MTFVKVSYMDDSHMTCGACLLGQKAKHHGHRTVFHEDDMQLKCFI